MTDHPDLDAIEARARRTIEYGIPADGEALLALTAEVRKLREALAPFAKAANEVGLVIHDQPGNLSVCDATFGAELVRMSTTDFFAARKALKAKEPTA